MDSQETNQNPSNQAEAPKSSANKSKAPLALGLMGAAVAVIVGGKLIFGSTSTQPQDQKQTTTPPDNSNTQTNTPTPVTAATYKDGTYTADGTYTVHKGPETITITLTLKDNVVTDTQFKGTPNFPMSQKFMDMFNENYKSMVIGKNINELHLGKVSGSSLTPNGFNDALEKIKAQAKS